MGEGLALSYSKVVNDLLKPFQAFVAAVLPAIASRVLLPQFRTFAAYGVKPLVVDPERNEVVPVIGAACSIQELRDFSAYFFSCALHMLVKDFEEDEGKSVIILPS
jgi:hypothetical protein